MALFPAGASPITPSRSLFGDRLISNAVSFNNGSEEYWHIHDNLFDHCDVDTASFYALTYGHNAYRLGSTDLSGTDLPADIEYASGPFGDRYIDPAYAYVSSLVNAGSRTAAKAGLSAYTILGNFPPNETQDVGTVDIGYHYPVADLTGGTFWTDPSPLAEQLARAIMARTGAAVVPGSATYTGAAVASGFFGNGSNANLPNEIDNGVMLASGNIGLAHGPNDSSGDPGEPDLHYGSSDPNLNDLVGGSSTATDDAAVLEFDIISANALTPEFQYVFASEEYPEWLAGAGGFNDVMAIFVSTTQDSEEWTITPADNIATVPGTTTPVSVNNINGGCGDSRVYQVDWVDPSNPTYYVDNADPNYDPLVKDASTPVYYIQFDGTTTLLTCQFQLAESVLTHVKIAIADNGDWKLDSAVFIQGQVPCP